MNKEFIPYEQSLALKELGFDEMGFGYYSIDDGLMGDGKIKLYFRPDSINYFNSKDVLNTEECKAPLWQQAFRWFRDEYKLVHSVDIGDEGTSKESYFVSITSQGVYGDYTTYEEAELECLQKLIEIVKSK